MIDFTAVQNSVKTLKNQLETNQIDEEAFEEHLLTLIDVAEDGHYWMYGHESERWFRHGWPSAQRSGGFLYQLELVHCQFDYHWGHRLAGLRFQPRLTKSQRRSIFLSYRSFF
jgi:hypothetical protein